MFNRFITVTVNGRALEAKKGETVMELCDRNGIKVPRLCHHPALPPRASCRICLVECDGKWLTPSCVTQVWDGLKISTNSPKVVESVKNNLNQLMEVHDERCSTCTANSKCNFRNYCYQFGVDTPKRLAPHPDNVDRSSHSIVFDPSKCILCSRCIRACEDVAGQNVLEFSRRGSKMMVQPYNGFKLQETKCIKCGQCTLYCPTGAMREKSQTRDVINRLKTRDFKLSIAQIAPAVRVNINDALGLKPGTISTGKLVNALRKIGFDIVYDTNFGADMTIVEEANELVERVTKGTGVFPMFTSCCPAWVNYVEQSRPDLMPNLSSCRSPMGMLSAIIKNQIPQIKNVSASEIFNVAIMPCTAKKDEIERSQLRTHDGVKETDIVLTVRELADLFKLQGINFTEMSDDDAPDSLFGEYSGAGAIFANTGGVMEAAVRTAHDQITGKSLERIEYHEVRGFERAIRIATINMGGKDVKVAVVHGIANCEKLLEKIKNGDEEFQNVLFIEVMACPGGCINGGGSSPCEDAQQLKARIDAIYKIDNTRAIRKSHENPRVKDLYEKVLGKPGSHLAHELLHTPFSYKEKK